MEQSERLLKAMDEVANYVATLTGMKRRLIEDGWSEQAAEAIIVHSIANAKAGGNG